MAEAWEFPVEPPDEHNRAFLENVRPAKWKNPEPGGRYNLVVVGAGPAGLVTAVGAAALGARVALVERHLMGGDCLNVGCVPSKSLIRSARLAHEMRNAAEFGLPARAVGPEAFPSVMERLRRIRARISRHDSARRLAELGVDLFLGEARFAGPDAVEAAGARLRFKKAVIAAGARALRPRIEGLDRVRFWTNETVFNLTELPRRLLVIGGGPLGCELAQAFGRLGSEVTLVQKGRCLAGEDPDASALLAAVLEREGVRLMSGAEPEQVVERGGRKSVTIRAGTGGAETVLEVDEILVGVGRQPNVEGLNLEAAGVAYDLRRGVQVDDFLRTTNRRIYAAGDVCMRRKFTHAADAAARIVLRNALFRGRARVSALTIPRLTYTDPEIAQTGLSEPEALERGVKIDLLRVEMASVDRAVTDGGEEGFLKLLLKKGTDRILGATLVAAGAGEIISGISGAIASGRGLKKLADVVYPYPTRAEIVKRAADAYNRRRLTPGVAALLRWWLSWR